MVIVNVLGLIERTNWPSVWIIAAAERQPDGMRRANENSFVAICHGSVLQ